MMPLRGNFKAYFQSGLSFIRLSALKLIPEDISASVPVPNHCFSDNKAGGIKARLWQLGLLKT